jgi:hypothetical protein
MGKQILGSATVILAAGAALRGQIPASFQPFGAAPPVIEGFRSQEVVPGKPFSATEERHSLQILADGTRIENSETNRLYRDEQGRTRVERIGGAVTVFDPVAGFSAELNPATKTAVKSPQPMLAMRVTNGNSDVESLRKRLQEFQLQSQQTNSPEQTAKLKAEIADLEKAIADSSSRVFRFTFGRDGQNVVLPLATKRFYFSSNGTPAPDPQAPVTLSVEPGDNGSVESLPAQTINGAMAEGTRTTETIPAGKIGNDRPISIVNERWFSPDLRLLVKSTSSDPRFGDTTYQLTNIVQSSPDPDLFRIPPEYTVTDQPLLKIGK